MSYLFTIPYDTRNPAINYAIPIDTGYNTKCLSMLINTDISAVLYYDGSNVRILSGNSISSGNNMFIEYQMIPPAVSYSSNYSSSFTDSNYPSFSFSNIASGYNIDADTALYDILPNIEIAKQVLYTGEYNPDIPITYYLTNCSAPSAPASVSPGGVVSFPVTVSPGYNIFNPVQGGSISVYQGDNYIPFTYENGVLSFTAPGGG